MNILDYLDWRGDITFAERGLNEVDNLIFSTLAYLDMDGLLPDEGSAPLTVAQLYAAYTAAGYDQSYMVNDPTPLLARCARSPRYRNVRVLWYVNRVDPAQQLQFSAATFLYRGDEIYIAFRGTDNTLVGWREDCNLSYLSETPGQREAADYVNMVAAHTTGPLTVGGHSKGGNFAVYAAAFCQPEVREQRVVKVYSNDGPGFKAEVTCTDSYLAVLSKTEKIIPDSSLVGILLSSKAERKVIHSDVKGVMQHNPFTWSVLGDRFVPADERTAASLFMDDTLSRWANSLSDENKQNLVNSVFDSLEASGAQTLNEINNNKWSAYNSFIKAIAALEPDNKSDLADTLKKLLLSGKDTAVAEAQKNIEKLKAENEQFPIK